MDIQIRNLTKQFGNVKALDDVSFDILDGELVFLLGPSGCGKTTLLRCIGGFEKPTQGQIRMDGKDTANLSADKRNTAMVFQGYALWPHLTVAENIAFGLEMQKLPKEEIRQRVLRAMEQVQIAPLAQRKPNELSGGQQQRVALARTMVVQPGCLLLDEPLANLDAKLRRDMRREIRDLCKTNHLTAIYVTHDRQEALSMADRIALLKDGRIIQTGTPQELYRSPVNAFAASFIGDTNFLEGIIRNGAIETAAGSLRANIPPQCKEGEKVTLSIRPEAITLVDSNTEQDNILPAVLQDSAYLGELASNRARTVTGNLPLDFLVLNPQRPIPAGTQLFLHISPENISVFPQ